MDRTTTVVIAAHQTRQGLIGSHDYNKSTALLPSPSTTLGRHGSGVVKCEQATDEIQLINERQRLISHWQVKMTKLVTETNAWEASRALDYR